MRKVKTIKLDGKEITVKELTVRQIKELLERIEDQEEIHTLDLLFDDIPALAISMSTGISMDELEGDISPSELEHIKKVVEEVNPFFARMLQRLREVGRSAQRNLNG